MFQSAPSVILLVVFVLQGKISSSLAVSCEDTITTNTVLSSDLRCDCGFLGALEVADDTSLDLAGYTVQCTSASSNDGPVIRLGARTTITNGFISNEFSRGSGISVIGVGTVVSLVTLDARDIGVALDNGSDGSIISQCVITNAVTGIDVNSDNNLIEDNTIGALVKDGAVGIYVSSGSIGSQILRNRVLGNVPGRAFIDDDALCQQNTWLDNVVVDDVTDSSLECLLSTSPPTSSPIISPSEGCSDSELICFVWNALLSLWDVVTWPWRLLVS